MPKLTYWVAECETDTRTYNLRAKTKKQVVEMLARHGNNPDGSRMRGFSAMYYNSYSKPHKVEVYYDDAFDLLVQCSNEGGIYEGL